MVERAASISDAEWEVMKVLWREAPLPSREIVQRLEPRTEWKAKTIHTLIGRLVQKKAVGVEKETGRYLYYPLLAEEKCQMQEAESFINKVFDGSVSTLVASFLSGDKISKEDVEELRRLLEDEDDYASRSEGESHGSG